MEEEITTKSFSETVENLFKLHYVTKKYEHYVRINPETLKLFEATKFVYAYFAFNSFYNYDWETSLKKNELTDYEGKIFVKNGEESTFGDIDKIRQMSDFIISRMEEVEKEFFSI